MEQPSNISRSALQPRQFVLADVLFLTAEITCLLALLQIEGVTCISYLMLTANVALLHKSRYRVAIGMAAGAVVGCGALALIAHLEAGVAERIWLPFGLLVVPQCALYGGTFHYANYYANVRTNFEQENGRLLAFIVLLPLLSIAGMCVDMRLAEGCNRLLLLLQC